MDSSIIRERIAGLRSLMAVNRIDAVIVPTGDYHLSEYTAPYFRTREFITGFTGSAGTAVITADDGGLWTDSRYYIQAADQLEGTGISLYKMQEPGVPSITDYLKSHLQDGSVVSFDGSIVSCSTYKKWQDELGPAGIVMDASRDLAGEMWEDRPALPCNPVFDFALEHAGESRREKISKVREDMKADGADSLFIASLSDIAWLLNLRGSDVHCNPVFLSYVLIDGDNVRLFTQKEAFSDELTGILEADGVSIEPYDAACEALASLPEGCTLWLSSAGANCSINNSVPEYVKRIDKPEPTVIRKAIKNEAEQNGEIQAHIKDGAAVCRWIYWLKSCVGTEEITEISAADKLYELRSEQEHFMGNSFDPIIGYGAHAAIVHYSSTPESDVPLRPEGLVLADTGGQYLEGTTDITRTIALGPVTDEERMMFTAVLRGHIALAMAVFRDGCNGHNLDILAHLPLWMMGKDYGHGTGHGVGHFLNVHEGPNHFHWNMDGSRGISPAYRTGMITSDEPGYYEAGKFGIRHESLLICVEKFSNEHGRFLGHDEITMVPFDLDAIDAEMLTYEEKNYLNSYHRRVFETISPYLSGDELSWLKDATRAL